MPSEETHLEDGFVNSLKTHKSAVQRWQILILTSHSVAMLVNYFFYKFIQHTKSFSLIHNIEFKLLQYKFQFM